MCKEIAKDISGYTDVCIPANCLDEAHKLKMRLKCFIETFQYHMYFNSKTWDISQLNPSLAKHDMPFLSKQ